GSARLPLLIPSSHGGSPFILSRIVRSGERNRHLPFQLNSGHPHEEEYDADSPLILDLNDDGIQTTGFDEPVPFDLDGDGATELLTWTDPTTFEGFLWTDINKNGTVDNGSELFGIGTVLPDGTVATDGFAALSACDEPQNGGNGDAMITADDSVWARLQIWVDANHNGVSENREIGPIHRFGITALDLNYSVDATPDSNGNIHLYRSTYTKRIPAGSRRLPLHDVFFRRVERP
ncbi:MAG: hypothetical protein ACRD2J_05060, partial [Thermoanaerobaculia bacterium]